MIYAIMVKICAPLALLLALMFTVAPAAADITGSGITKFQPAGPLALGQYVPLRLRVINGSPDFNWISRIDLRFPPCCTVVAMGYDDSHSTRQWVFEMTGMPGSAVSYVDGEGDEWGEIPAGDYGYLDLLVHVEPDCPASERLWYDLYGDVWGAEPRELLNRFLFLTFDEVASETESWSTIKSRY